MKKRSLVLSLLCFMGIIFLTAPTLAQNVDDGGVDEEVAPRHRRKKRPPRSRLRRPPRRRPGADGGRGPPGGLSGRQSWGPCPWGN